MTWRASANSASCLICAIRSIDLEISRLWSLVPGPVPASVVIPLLLPPRLLPPSSSSSGVSTGVAAVGLRGRRAGSVPWIAAVVGAADLLLRVQPLEHEVDGGRQPAAPARPAAMPARCASSISPCTLRASASTSAAGTMSPRFSVPPRSNHSTTWRDVGVGEVAVEDVRHRARGSARAPTGRRPSARLRTPARTCRSSTAAPRRGR